MISLSYSLIFVALITTERQFKHNLTANQNNWLNEYDFVIVGGGTAGCVVANRLAETNFKVIVVEAGPAQSVLTDMPGMELKVVGSEFDWSYPEIPQRMGLGYANKSIIEPRGRILGGSSNINDMGFIRGNRKDFDNWANSFGAIGWSYAEVLPYFKKYENNSDLSLIGQNPGFHGMTGPVGVETIPNPYPIDRLIVRGIHEYGFDVIDLNGPKQIGTAINQAFVKRGLRQSAGNAYVDPNPYPNYLHILTNAFVTKILFRKQNDKTTAFGVEFIKNGIKYTINANKEVILSAGSIGSPQILMLSGIGPEEHLKQLGIHVIENLPVGKNLQNHPLIPVDMIIKDDKLAEPLPDLNVDQLYQLYQQNCGPLSMFPMLTTYFSSQYNADKDWPDVNIEQAGLDKLSDLREIISKFDISRRAEWADYYRPFLNRKYMLSYSQVMRVESYGSVRLASTDPFVYPIIDPQYLANPRDMDAMIEATKFNLFVFTKTPISNYLTLIPKPIPGCVFCPNKPIYECDSYVRCLIQQLGTTGYHPVGTCRMGSIHRTDVVVDPMLKVKKVCGLRVIDTSIMPQLTNGNTGGVAFMIGEHGADLVKRDYLKQ